mmetsp:Transcript_171/g.468  ORF Transcript_171/g.468 Transcript_171/m.468 type:complete len:211 (-) Transcript_171:488-1120(-)
MQYVALLDTNVSTHVHFLSITRLHYDDHWVRSARELARAAAAIIRERLIRALTPDTQVDNRACPDFSTTWRTPRRAAAPRGARHVGLQDARSHCMRTSLPGAPLVRADTPLARRVVYKRRSRRARPLRRREQQRAAKVGHGGSMSADGITRRGSSRCSRRRMPPPARRFLECRHCCWEASCEVDGAGATAVVAESPARGKISDAHRVTRG